VKGFANFMGMSLKANYAKYVGFSVLLVESGILWQRLRANFLSHYHSLQPNRLIPGKKDFDFVICAMAKFG